MGFLDFLFKEKPPPEPPGKGLGPSFVAPPDNPPVPYVKAAYTYADEPDPTKPEQEQMAAGKYFAPPPGIPPEQWDRYNPLQKQELWQLEQLKGEEGWPYEITRKTRAADPRWNPPEANRVTQNQSPSNFRFTRPFDVSSAKYLNGNHFSQADLQSNVGYQYTGTPISATGVRRNTYRTEPRPWDADIVDKAPEAETVDMTYVSPNIPRTNQQSWRLT